VSRAAPYTFAAVDEVRRFAVAVLDEAAQRSGRRHGLAAPRLDDAAAVAGLRGRGPSGGNSAGESSRHAGRR
jgi:hypothetical protein